MIKHKQISEEVVWKVGLGSKAHPYVEIRLRLHRRPDMNFLIKIMMGLRERI
jgi:hypothetical protein